MKLHAFPSWFRPWISDSDTRRRSHLDRFWASLHGLQYHPAPPLAGAELTFWGFPAAESHEPQRFPKGSPGTPAGCAGRTDTSCISGVLSSINDEPLTDNPTTCTGEPLATSLEVQTYEDPEHFSVAKSSYPAVVGCEKEEFKPLLYASPTTNETDAPSGLDINLVDPQFEGFASSPSELQSATVTLPPGLTINPDAADGQTACTEDQANFHSEGPADCPDQSKIGTFVLHSVALEGALDGSVYIGEPQPGNQYRVFLTASGFGMNVKLVGSLIPNPETGQVTASFQNLPQVPFDEFDLHLFSGERALMATPNTCTIYTTEANFFPWDAALPPTKSSQIFGLQAGPHGAECPGQVRPFNPSLVAGTEHERGAYSAFTLKLSREDGDQTLGDLNFTMPPGLTANLHGISYCSDASIAQAAQTRVAPSCHPSCPLSQKSAHPFSPPGLDRTPLRGRENLLRRGPSRNALSLVAVTPALLAPTITEPWSSGALHSIPRRPRDRRFRNGSVHHRWHPARLRSIQVNINKPNFMINPTNCSPFTVA